MKRHASGSEGTRASQGVRGRLGAGAALSACLLIWLFLWPADTDPEGWHPSPLEPFSATELTAWSSTDTDRLRMGEGTGPDGLAVDASGRIYTGLSDGTIVRFGPDDDTTAVFARTGGRPYGLAFGPDGTLWVADRMQGLLAVTPEGRVVPHIGGSSALARTNAVAVGPLGTVYLTDASNADFGGSPAVDIVENRPRGRLLAYDPAARRILWSVDSLYFPNGVAVASDGRSLLISESSRYRVRRLVLKDKQPGEWHSFADHLPGFPDGLSIDTDGAIWIALAAPRSRLLDALGPVPVLRRALLRILMAVPEALRPERARGSWVLRYGPDGRRIGVYVVPPNGFAPITSVMRTGSTLYLGSYRRPSLVRVGL